MKNDSEVNVATLSIVKPKTVDGPDNSPGPFHIYLSCLKFNLTRHRKSIQCMNFVKYIYVCASEFTARHAKVSP